MRWSLLLCCRDRLCNTWKAAECAEPTTCFGSCSSEAAIHFAAAGFVAGTSAAGRFGAGAVVAGVERGEGVVMLGTD